MSCNPSLALLLALRHATTALIREFKVKLAQLVLVLHLKYAGFQLLLRSNVLILGASTFAVG